MTDFPFWLIMGSVFVRRDQVLFWVMTPWLPPPPPHLRRCSIFFRPLLRCWKHKHWSLLFVRSKPVEQLSPTQSPSDWEAKLERKKSQPSHVGTQSPAAVWHNCVRFFFLLLTPAFVLPPVVKDERSVSQVVQGGQQRRAAQAKWVPPPPLMWTWGADHFSKSECFPHQATPAPCRETFYIRGNCLSPTTGSVSTPRSLAKTQRYSHSCLRFIKKPLVWSCLRPIPECSAATSRSPSLWCLWRSLKKPKLRYWCQTPWWLKLKVIR